MKILLVGEYSNVHWTLAQGLRALGHTVTVVSDGDSWKGYPRDVNLRRRSLGKIDTLRYLIDIERTLPTLKGYDVVQLINPVFLNLRGERIPPYYKRLRKQNGRLYLGAFGIDKMWVEQGTKSGTFRYSDFYINGIPRHTPATEEMKANWLYGSKARLNDLIADDCDGIVSGLYEYHVCYLPRYAGKLTYIPLPIDHSTLSPRLPHPDFQGLRFFVGVQKERSAYKGTDILLQALQMLLARHEGEMQVTVAESVSYRQYQSMMDTSDVLADQLYSYTPAMNALLAMAKGLVAISGGEEEPYELLGERELRPVVNVRPGSPAEVASQIEEKLFTRKGEAERLGKESALFTRRWHDHISVARRYEALWQQPL